MQLRIEKSGDGMGIPYPAQMRDGTPSNFGYLDLKKHPELIDSVSEVAGWPELKMLIMELNHPRSLFRSLSCEVAPNGDCFDPLKRWKITSFLRIAFEILSWNNVANYESMFRKFQALTNSKPNPDLLTIEFEIHPATFHDHQHQGYAVTIWTHGYGASEEAARIAWVNGIDLAVSFFARERDRHQNELDKGEKTIS